MQRYAVESSTISFLTYDDRARILVVHLVGGRSYRYFDVPEFTVRAFLKAESKGEYFTRCIVGQFRFEEIRNS